MNTTRRMRIGAVAFSFVTAGALALSGCSASSSSSSTSGGADSGNLDVRVYADWPFVKDNATEFMKLHPKAHITVGAIDNDTLRQSGGRMFLSSDSPDIVSYTVAQDLYNQWVKAKAVLPLDDVWKAAGLDSVTPRSVTDSLTANDKQKYAVPLGLTLAPVLFYNTKVWSAAGATAPDASHQFTSLDAFNAALAKVKAAGYTPLAITGGSLTPIIFDSLFPSSCGSKFMDISNNYKKGSTAKYTDECVVKALATFQDWVKNGYIESGMNSSTQQSTQALFENQKSGAWLQGSWTPPVFTPSFDYDWSLLPSLSSSEAPIAAAADSFLVPAKAKNPALAKSFIEYMVKKSTLESGMGRVPAQSGLDVEKVVKGNKIEAGLADAATSGSHKVVAIWDTLAPATVITTLYTNVVPGLINGTMTPTQGAAQLQSTLEQYRSKNG